MIEEDVEVHSLLGVASKQSEQKVLKLWRRSHGKPESTDSENPFEKLIQGCDLLRCQVCVLLVEVLQLLRCVSLEWSFSCQALEHYRSE